MQGKRHRKKVANLGRPVHCSVCERDMSANDWESHILGYPHRNAAAQKAVPTSVEPEEGISLPGQAYCGLCKLSVPRNFLNLHNESLRHKNKERYAAYKVVLDEAEKDKNGVTVDGIFDFGILDPAAASVGRSSSPRISSTIAASTIRLVRTELASSKGRRPVVSPYAICISSS